MTQEELEQFIDYLLNKDETQKEQVKENEQ